MKSWQRFLLILVLIAASFILQSLPRFAIAETLDERSPLFIKSLSPGFKINDEKNVGEAIEIGNSSPDEVDLSGYVIFYTNSSNSENLFFEFPEATVAGESSIILRFKSSPEEADFRYNKELALSGGIRLVLNEETVDSLFWNGGENYQKFKNTNPMVLVKNLENGEFEYVPFTDYVWPETGKVVIKNTATNEEGTTGSEGDNVSGEGDTTGVEESTTGSEEGTATNEEDSTTSKEDAVANIPKKCQDLAFSEIFTYYENLASEQFIELINNGDEVELSGCSIQYKNKSYPLEGIVPAGKYFVFFPEAFGLKLTKNPSTSNKIEIIDADGSVADELIVKNGQKRAMALAQFGFLEDGTEQWLQTYAQTPGADNDFQKFKTCEEGKVINEATGNCVKATTLDTEVEECPAGKYRNPLTGRCKAYETETLSLAPCLEGYERNPETGRCRKIKTNTGASYEIVEEEMEEKTDFIAGGAIGLIIVAGSIYIIWQFHEEIGNFFSRFKHKRGKIRT